MEPPTLEEVQVNLRDAVDADLNGDGPLAIWNYLHLIQQLLLVLKLTILPGRTRCSLLRVCKHFMEKCWAIKSQIAANLSQNKSLLQKPHKLSHEELVSYMYQSTIVSSNPHQMTDIVGYESVKKRVLELLPFRDLSKDYIMDSTKERGFLLIGPPGTCKTVMAYSAAKLVRGRSFFHLDSSKILSAFKGQSQVLLIAFFDMVRDHRPAVVFMDEVCVIHINLAYELKMT